MNAEEKHINLLLVEDSPTDAELTKRAVEQVPFPIVIHRVSDGIQALDFLWQRGDFSLAPRPDLIFLDLNMPKLDGREVLKEIKSEPRLSSIPVVVLTTSDLGSDVDECYQLSCNAYMVKPVSLSEFLDVITIASNYWFRVANIPKN